MEAVKNDRLIRVTELIKQHDLDCVLINNPSLGNLDTWLIAKEDMPLHIPFNRNPVYLVNRDGQVHELCARTPHPCDWGKFPVITEIDLLALLSMHGQPDTGIRIGLVNPAYFKKIVRDDLKNRYNAVFTDISNEFHLLKMKKTADEIAGVKNAAALFDRAFTTIPMILTGEHTEREIAAAIRNRFRELDAECEDLQTSTMLRMTSAPQNENAIPEPVEWPGRRITYGDRINISVNGFMKGGFASALARTFIIGEPSEESVFYWGLAVQAQQLIAENAKPGTTVRSLMNDFEKYILRPNGLLCSSRHQIYGIGAGISEAPRNIDSTCDIQLDEGMTIVISPEICPEDKDPYCLADVFVITRYGAERLNMTRQNLYILD